MVAEISDQHDSEWVWIDPRGPGRWIAMVLLPGLTTLAW
jgi:hypothetical protein